MRLGLPAGISIAGIRLHAGRVLTSFWFTPFLMGLGGFAAALAMIVVDERLAGFDGRWMISWEMERSTARSLLAALATATVSAASVVYSLSLLIRTLAASTLGPRLVENFRRASITRVALGAQLAVFVYALTTLFQTGVVERMPALSVLVATVGMVVAMALLVIFVNAIADQVSVDQIVGRVAARLKWIIAGRVDDREDGPALLSPPPDGEVVTSAQAGYVQALDLASLAATEALAGRRVQLLVRPGDFVVARQPLAQLDRGEVPDAAVTAIRSAVITGDERTREQDPISEFNLLVEVALRALSPGVNDVFTAVACMHHLAAALADLDGTDLGVPAVPSRNGNAEVRPRPLRFAEVVDTVFDPLRHAGSAIPLFTVTMLDSLEALVATSRNADARALWRRHAALVVAEALPHIAQEVDREALREHGRRIERMATTTPGEAEATFVAERRDALTRPRGSAA